MRSGVCGRLRLRREKHAASRANWDEQRPHTNQIVGAEKLARRLFRRRPAPFHDP